VFIVRLKKLYLTAYRAVGFGVLAAGLATMVSWGILMLFFMFSTSWVAPTVLSPTSDKMLQFNTGYQSAVQNLETLKVTMRQAERDLEYARANARTLHGAKKDLVTSIDGVAKVNENKVTDLHATSILIQKLQEIEKQNLESRQRGLITNEEAIQAAAQVQSLVNANTDNAISFFSNHGLVLTQAIQLAQQIAQADNDVKTKEDTLQAAQLTERMAENVVSTLEATAYAHAQRGGANLAFLPYDNIKIAKIGAPVYDCYLMIIACHRVGTIKHIYHDEQLVDFPLFNVRLSRTVRGIFVDMDMTHPEYMGSTVMFIGKPLLF